MHVNEVRPRKDHRGVDLISDVLPFGRLWYDTPDNAIGYAMHSSRSHDAVIRVYEELRSAVSVEMYGASSVTVLAKLEDPKVAVLWDGHFACTLLLRLFMMPLATCSKGTNTRAIFKDVARSGSTYRVSHLIRAVCSPYSNRRLED